VELGIFYHFSSLILVIYRRLFAQIFGVFIVKFFQVVCLDFSSYLSVKYGGGLAKAGNQQLDNSETPHLKKLT
jgi:hypothetical protein